MRHLGPPRFEFLGRAFVREDFVVQNVSGQTLHVSRWGAEERAPMVPTMIFMFRGRAEVLLSEKSYFSRRRLHGISTS